MIDGPSMRTGRAAGCKRFLRTSLLLAATAALFVSAASPQETARAKALGQKLMCVCGCNQILTACNHVGCTYSHTQLKELDQAVARN